MKDDLHFIRLWDLYSPLLTANQREITDLYFNYDLSLAEIAEQKGVSRQSVSDCLNKSRKQLEDYDKKLGFIKLLDGGDAAFSAYMTEVSRWIEEKKNSPQWLDGAKELETRLDATLEKFGVEVIKR
ncbi:MAG: DNA-binding protein [Clostridia bacterium]|nr:DNA-binding protein [Clostridia bacterium]